MRTTTNNKRVIAGVQAHLLEWANDQKLEYEGLEKANTEEAFVEILNKYINSYGKDHSREARSWSTPDGVLEHFCTGGDLYYRNEDIKRLFEQWGLDPNKYDCQKNFETYTRLVCRDGARLYSKIKNKLDKQFVGEIIDYEWLNNSNLGHPRFRLWVRNKETGVMLVGKVGSNSQAGYTARVKNGIDVRITYHTTKSGSVIIDFIRKIE